MLATAAALADGSTERAERAFVAEVVGSAVKDVAPGIGGQGAGGEPCEMLVAFCPPEELHRLLDICELPLVPGGRPLPLPLFLSLSPLLLVLLLGAVAAPLLLLSSSSLVVVMVVMVTVVVVAVVTVVVMVAAAVVMIATAVV